MFTRNFVSRFRWSSWRASLDRGKRKRPAKPTGGWLRRGAKIISSHRKLALWIETATVFAFLGFACWAGFGHRFVFGGRVLPVEFLPIAPLIWIAARLGLRATALALAVIASCAIWPTFHGLGPFVPDARQNSAIFLTAYLCVIAVTSLALEVLNRLMKAREELAKMIHRRTERLQIISDCLAQLVSPKKTEHVVSDICSGVAAHIGADACFNYLRTPEAGGCKLVSQAGVSEKDVCEICCACSGSVLLCRAARTRALVRANALKSE